MTVLDLLVKDVSFPAKIVVLTSVVWFVDVIASGCISRINFYEIFVYLRIPYVMFA